jgi:L-2-hydroxyglutarate oxidase LhgO
MKIAIIGGGWIGCHLANKLGDVHDITIYEKNSTLFTETSYKNQNRLHLGYHYARSFETRELCLSTFDRFIDDYGFATEKVDKNLYCVASN